MADQLLWRRPTVIDFRPFCVF